MRQRLAWCASHPLNYLGLCPVVALLVSACAAGWQHPTKGEAAFNQDRYECQQQAAASYPPNMIQPQAPPPYQAPSTTTCRNNGYGQLNCSTVPGQVVPQIQPMPQDANAMARVGAFSMCMQARGYTR